MQRRVLIVDDSPEDRETVSLALRRDSQVRYSVHEVTNGSDGLSLLRESNHSFDLVVLDYRLPDMNAEQFVAKLIGPDQTPSVPIIVLTGSMEGRLEEADALRHGVQDFFTKQEVTSEVISRVARNAIERHRLVRKLVESERAAEEAKAAAERANRAKSQFLALVSHELRTPLTAVLGFTELLRKNPTAEDAGEMLHMIAGSGEHLAGLLNDLIDIAKVEAGTLDVGIAEFNPRELVEAACRLMAIRAGDKGLRLNHRLADSIPSVICSDAIRLRQVLINLLGNAIKFTDDGEVRCTVGWSEDDSTLSVEVSDTGPGVPEEIAQTLFTPFVQGRTRSGAQREGIGLGLAISRNLARMLGGDLVIKQTGPAGTTFRLTIDAPVGPEEAARPNADSPSASLEIPDLTGRRVLIVEDTAANRYLLRRLLSTTNADIDEAANGQEAVELVTSGRAIPFDMIFMDMMMPVMDGFEATRQLRGKGVTTPIIALTAAAFSEDQQRCRESGCDDVMTKPIDTAMLFRQIVSLIG